ncbi:peptidase M50 [Frankia sp. CNm7]|uniref:Peptidase M50 n=1 Tax=Frankia nepalensis TaxID=1836974 RepID=A0A937US69_9ACTN|nr:peptidase M50 [Frankia nepalensis]MBL7497414.1 peptidase M50 [Frankia nepalensis]MBL7512750.1 peptidase M50 [Frankia nepalensis]MBL7517822.1 peptidase M50 [Frankia nepalensis]MBL7632147.1 peptidase M50 [Frankia nepalensis]
MGTQDAARGGRLPRIVVRPGLVVSVAVVTALLGWLTLPVTVPDRTGSAYLSAGLLGALLLLAILTAADLARSVAARRGGLTVRAIELGVFGSRLVLARPPLPGGGWRRGPDEMVWGAGSPAEPYPAEPAEGARRPGQLAQADQPDQPPAQEGRPSPSGLEPRADAAIARAGLLTTGLVGAVFVTLGALAPDGTLALAGQVALWVGSFTLLITLVDLLPSPRTPGGRILAARVLRRTGDPRRAEAVVARTGVAIGWAMIALGVAACFTVGLIGLWAVLLGWMALGSSRLAQASQRAGSALEGVFVRDVMLPPPPRLPSWQTVGEALREVARPGAPVSTVFTVHDFDSSLAGVALARALAGVPLDDRDLARVSRVTIPLSAVPTARPDEPLAVVAPRLAARPSAGCVLVLDEEQRDEHGRPRIVGLVGPAEIRRAIETAPLRSGSVISSFGRPGHHPGR